jgi:hypothetical protein
MLVVGIVVYLFTGSPLVGVAVASSHAAANGLSTALWLLRFHPSRAAALIGALFHVSAACWQVAAHALITVLAMMLAAQFFRAAPNLADFKVTMLALASGVVLPALLGVLGSCMALRYGVKVWVRPKLREELQQVDVLTSYGFSRRFNYAVFVIGTSLVFPAVAVASGLLIFFTANPKHTSMPGAVFSFALLLVGPLIAIGVYVWISHRILARTPAEYWAV